MKRLAILLLCVLTVILITMPVLGAGHGGDILISDTGSMFPDVACDTVNGRFLVVWTNYAQYRVYGRIINGNGTPLTAAFPISDAGYGCLFSAVAYNATNQEYLVTWDEWMRSDGSCIYGQRISKDGTMLGQNIPIGSVTGGIRSAVDWNSTNNNYLVVYYNGGVYGQLISNTGAKVGPEINIAAGNWWAAYPAVSYSSSSNQFLVTYDFSSSDYGPNDGFIRGRRVSGTGTVIDTNHIVITTGGDEQRSSIACDNLNNRWLVQHWQYGADQFGRFVKTDGTIEGSPIAIADTAAFEGETNFGADIAFNSGLGRYLSVYQSYGGYADGIGGTVLNRSGERACPLSMVGLGQYGPMAVAADSVRNTFLSVWHSDENFVIDPYHAINAIRCHLCILNSNPATSFTATGDGGQNTLRWTNPTDTHFSGAMIRYSTTGYPATINDGTLVIDKPGEPGANNMYVHSGLTNGVTYYYSVFAHNIFNEYSTKVTASATPNAVTFHNSTFTSATGWTYTRWGFNADSATWGTIGWEGGVGNPTGGIRCMGYGDTDNNDRALREGGDMKRIISTAGYTNIKLSYDLRVGTLGTAWSGAGTGGASVLNNDIQDQLIVYYSKAGVNGPWYEADWLGHNDLLSYVTYGRRSVDLSAISGVADNPNFALKFIWQFNSKLEAGDCGDLDNVKLFGNLIPDPIPPTATVGAPSVLSTSTGPIVYSVNFSESVTGFSASGDVIVNKTGTATAGPASISGSGAGPYTVTLSNITGSGILGITVKAGACSDVAGNSNTASSPSVKTLVISADGSIASAKTTTENSAVTLGNKVLYYKNGTVGYIEESDRFAGIRIEGSIPQSEGEKVSLSGAVKTNASGERYILLDVILPAGSESVEALGTNNRAAKLAVMDGLLTTVWGLVTPDSITSNSFIISDGSDSEGIKIITPGEPGVTVNTYVTVTGAAGRDNGKRVIYKK